MRKLLFLSSQFTGYFYECLKELVDNHKFEVQVIHWDNAVSSPFQFVEYQHINIHLKSNFTSQTLLKHCIDFQPEVVIFPGWMDKDYLKIVAQLKQKGTITIMGFDNQWKGNLKQRLLALLGYQWFRRYFSVDYIWVAGMYQYEYVRRIGFPKNKILLGLYTANQPVFNAEYQQIKSLKAINYPKNFVYIGRFEPIKNPVILYRVFKNIVAENLHKGWSLTMIGTGTEEFKLKPSEGIEIRKFVQPQGLAALMPKFGCLVLPSIRESWGVVVHEAVSAGLPLILTSTAGAKSAFLSEGYNGFLFESQDEESLKQALLKIIHTDDETLMKMAERSSELSFQITPSFWAYVLKSVLKQLISTD
jgi:glycosyltransferase involved in cell wall biosynthesis